MEMSPLRKSFVFSSAPDASTSISQLELRRPRTSKIPESLDGAEKLVGLRQVDHAYGVAEIHGQHTRI